MLDQGKPSRPSAPNVSLAWVMPALPTRADAFRHAMTAVLQASFSFGQAQPAQLLYSYDAQGEDYSAPVSVPAGAITCLSDAVDLLGSSADYYNHRIGLSFPAAQRHVRVTGRVYDEPGMLVISLDFEPASWRQLVAACRSVRGATGALLDAGRVLFTLMPLRYLLIGPSASLVDLPPLPSALLPTTPAALLVGDLYRRQRARLAQIQHLERVPRGYLVVQQWDACHPVAAARPARSAAARPKER